MCNVAQIEFFRNLIDKCKTDYNRYVHGNLIGRYNYIKDIMIEFATVYLGCLLQRSASYASFGKIASEVVAVKYMKYQEISQIYYEKQLTKE